MKAIDADKLSDLAAALTAQGVRVFAPLRDGDRIRLAPWRDGAEIDLSAPPINSAKDVLFPRSEIVGRFAVEGDSFEPRPVAPEAPPTVVLGVRPCDAAGLAALDAVFNWDYADAFYNARRAATTVAALACTDADEQCFCTSVGGAPDNPAGADVLLRSAEGGRTLLLEPRTDKGAALVERVESRESDAPADEVAEVPRRFEAGPVAQWCEGNFDSPLWTEWSLPCLGCGACAYACVSCHCFDIQDETAPGEAVRLRNWDSCGFALFTLHTSGHNPRPDQAARWRNRVTHKFQTYPAKFEMIACTGCGRCARLCPAGMSMKETVAAIADRAHRPSEKQ